MKTCRCQYRARLDVQDPQSWNLFSSGRFFEELLTFGRGWVEPLAVPSADKMVTVALEVILKVLMTVVVLGVSIEDVVAHELCGLYNVVANIWQWELKLFSEEISNPLAPENCGIHSSDL